MVLQYIFTFNFYASLGIQMWISIFWEKIASWSFFFCLNSFGKKSRTFCTINSSVWKMNCSKYETFVFSYLFLHEKKRVYRDRYLWYKKIPRKIWREKIEYESKFRRNWGNLFLERKSITKSSHNMQEKENSNLFDSIVTKTELLFFLSK